MLCGTYDVRNLHDMVIDYRSKVIQWNAIGFLNDKITHESSIRLYYTTNHIVEGNLVVGYPQTYGSLATFGTEGIFFFLCQMQTTTAIAGVFFARILCFALGSQFFGRAEALVGLAFVEELLHIFMV